MVHAVSWGLRAGPALQPDAMLLRRTPSVLGVISFASEVLRHAKLAE
jgi:hypothetical protein